MLFRSDNVVIKKGKMFICSSNIMDGLYILTPDKHELYNSELDHNSHGLSRSTHGLSRVGCLTHSYPYT